MDFRKKRKLAQLKSTYGYDWAKEGLKEDDENTVYSTLLVYDVSTKINDVLNEIISESPEDRSVAIVATINTALKHLKTIEDGQDKYVAAIMIQNELRKVIDGNKGNEN